MTTAKKLVKPPHRITRSISFRIPLYQLIKQLALKENRSFNWIVVEAVTRDTLKAAKAAVAKAAARN
jgi:hypothetical protein